MADRFAPPPVRMWWDPRQGMRSAVETYQRMIGQPAAQLIGGGVRGFLGLDVPSYATDLGREAYRTGQAMGNMPGIGAPAGAFKAAAMGAQALPAVAGELGRMVSMMPTPRQAAALQAEDFLAYQRGIPVQDISPLTAYHGTPHRFPAEEGAPLGRFRSEKIGSGEGAQVYGYGLYFAESPGVAKSYKIGLSNPAPMLTQEIENVLPDVLKGKAPNWADEILSGKTFSDLLASVKQPWQKTLLRQNKEPLEALIKRQQTGGSLYTVDIPDAMVDRMLDWDKPLAKQSDAVYNAFRKAYQNKYVTAHPNSPTGTLMLQLQQSLGAKGAADYLREAGIPGIRYIDEGSRAGGEGTRNIVVFPGEEKAIKILARE